MSDIPEDIMRAALKLMLSSPVEFGGGVEGGAVLRCIIDGITAERERFAQIALRNVEFWRTNPTSAIPAISAGFIRCAEDIAAAIRSPERAGE